MSLRQILFSFCVVITSSLSACIPVTPATSNPKPDATAPADGSPLPALLEITGTSQTAGVGTFCWKTQTANGEAVDMCVDKIGLPTVDIPLDSTSPVIARLTLPLNDPPKQLGLSVFRATPENEVKVDTGRNGFRYWIPGEGLNQELGLQTIQDITVDLEPGLFVFYVFGVWEGKGDVSYGFLVQVK